MSGSAAPPSFVFGRDDPIGGARRGDGVRAPVEHGCAVGTPPACPCR
jgi:hypothetical protein